MENIRQKIAEIITHTHKTPIEQADEILILSGVVNCVYVVTEQDSYGEQLFRQVFAKEEQAIEYLAKQGLKAGNIDEINEVELD
tara:strand:+ start:372 stop:623 length:252 start_codon:yes stop_codon:yes gene_type:complete